MFKHEKFEINTNRVQKLIETIYLRTYRLLKSKHYKTINTQYWQSLTQILQCASLFASSLVKPCLNFGCPNAQNRKNAKPSDYPYKKI